MSAKSQNAPTLGHQRRRTATRLGRALAAGAFGGVIAASLGGCLFAYDPAKPNVSYVNEYAEPVVVFIEGFDPEKADSVRPDGANHAPLDQCLGTGFRVETESGEVVGRLAEQACPGWRLTIHEDGSLTYEEVTY